MKKDFIKKIFAIFTLFLIFFPLQEPLSAQSTARSALDYAVLAPLPFTTVNCNVPDSNNNPVAAECTDLARYLPNAFNLAIGIAVALAFIVIVYGGVMYATSDALSGKSAGREAIENALWGLLLVIGAYMILQTINPQMLTFDLTIQQFTTNPNSTAGTGGTTGGVVTPVACCNRDPVTGVLLGYTLTPAEVQQNSTILDTLQSRGVQVNAGPCTTGGTQGCTNLVGLPQSVINGLITLKSNCDTAFKSCFVQVTGGAEGGHRTHGPGRPSVDINTNASINAYLGTINPQARTPTNNLQVNLPGGGVATYETTGANGRATGDHWHIQY